METEICVKHYNNDVNNKDVIQVDYVVIGGTYNQLLL